MGLRSNTDVSTLIAQSHPQNNSIASDQPLARTSYDELNGLTISESLPANVLKNAQTQDKIPSKSRIRDLDSAEETSNLAQQRVLHSPTIAVLAQANAKPDMALQLMR